MSGFLGSILDLLSVPFEDSVSKALGPFLALFVGVAVSWAFLGWFFV